MVESCSILQSQFSVGGGVEFGFDDESSNRIAFPIGSISPHRKKSSCKEREKERKILQKDWFGKKEILMKKK